MNSELDSPPPLPPARIPKQFTNALRRIDIVASTTGRCLVIEIGKKEGLRDLRPEARVALGGALSGTHQPTSDGEWLAYTAAIELRRLVEDEAAIAGLRYNMCLDHPTDKDGIDRLVRLFHLAALDIAIAREFGANGQTLDELAQFTETVTKHPAKAARQYFDAILQQYRTRLLQAPLEELRDRGKPRAMPWLIGGAVAAIIAGAFRAC